MLPRKTIPFICRKDWGGDRLRAYGKDVGSGNAGESWELSAHAGGECSIYGMPFSKAIEKYGDEMAGTAAQGDFPLLVKLIDARETLSVQIHPDDRLAQQLFGEPFGKTEAWVILEAPEGATLTIGGHIEKLTHAIKIGRDKQDLSQIGEHLCKLPVKPGDCVYIPAGTIHAIEAGVLLYEVQQSSDRTFRLYAWGRDVPLHFDEALLAMEIPSEAAGLSEPVEIPVQGGKCHRLIDCAAFTLDRLSDVTEIREKTDGSRFFAYTALASGELIHPETTIPYSRGDTIFVPATAGNYALRGGELLKAYVN